MQDRPLPLRGPQSPQGDPPSTLLTHLLAQAVCCQTAEASQLIRSAAGSKDGVPSPSTPAAEPSFLPGGLCGLSGPAPHSPQLPPRLSPWSPVAGLNCHGSLFLASNSIRIKQQVPSQDGSRSQPSELGHWSPHVAQVTRKGTVSNKKNSLI